MTASNAFHSLLDLGQPLTEGDQRLQVACRHPVRILQAHDATTLQLVLQQVEQAAREGQWCVGGLRYEAASALQPGLCTHAANGALAWFAIYDVVHVNAIKADRLLHAEQELEWENALKRSDFERDVARIHAGIAAGAYYQINYTQQLQGMARQAVDGPALFAALQQAQPGGYALCIHMGEEQIASVSPELFFDWHQPSHGPGHILTRPMKGTAARGITAQADAEQARHLQTSPKERAENVMIVDLLRNDLGMIAQTGSVQVPHLFQVQALPTVWQMTSDVCAVLPQDTSLWQVFEALFPCGSVTGAPKRAAMQAIAQLEKQPRGWYCGALGVVRPDGAGGIRATFNVPIRTLVVQGPQQQTVRCGIGSGITADARAAGEWQEWQTKRAFVDRVSQSLEVITTMALENGAFRHLPWHMQRLQEAAAHFGFPMDAQARADCLQQVLAAHGDGLWRVRLALRRDGVWSYQVAPGTPAPVEAVLQLAHVAMPESHSEFVRFKTSRRAHYERFAPPEGVMDTVLWNVEGEITEGTRGNIAAWMEGRWVTPPLSCGLLNGVGRQVALAQGRVVEGVIRIADVPRVQQWAWMNSLRGWVPARLAGGTLGVGHHDG